MYDKVSEDMMNAEAGVFLNKEETLEKPRVEDAVLPSSLPELTITIPTGRPGNAGELVIQAIDQLKVEAPNTDAMFLLALHGDPSDEQLTQAFAHIPSSDRQRYPVYFMTKDTNSHLYEKLLGALPTDVTEDPFKKSVVKDMALKTHYANQRTKMLWPFSTDEESQHSEHVDLSLDDDLSVKSENDPDRNSRRSRIPKITEAFAERYGIPIQVNGKVYLPRDLDLSDPNNISWIENNSMYPYLHVNNGFKPEFPPRARGINEQNTALEKGVFAPFLEHLDENSPVLTDPNMRYVLAFGSKWNNPDVEAWYKLLSDIKSGDERSELAVQAVLTGNPAAIAMATHPVNMDTAHMARYWKHGKVMHMFPWLASSPEISDKFGTISRTNADGSSGTLGYRAEMWLLVGENGLLKQVSDALNQQYLAVQTSAVFEHRRLPNSSIRANEAISAFSEFLGLTMGDIVRENTIVDPDRMRVTINDDIIKKPEIVDTQIVQNMYDNMQTVLMELDRQMLQTKDPKRFQLLDSTKKDIEKRLRTNEGFQAFNEAVNEEIRLQLTYQKAVMEVHSETMSAGATLRRKGEFPVKKLI